MKNGLFVFTGLILAACQRNVPAAENRSAIADSIRHTLHNYYKDISLSGLTAEFSYLDSSADFFWAPPGYSSALSYDSVRSILLKNAPVFKSIRNSFDTLHILPLSAELASYTCRIRSIMTDTAGKTTTCTLVETGTLIKRENGWKLLNGQTSILKQQ
jgi:hypothetical protein